VKEAKTTILLRTTTIMMGTIIKFISAEESSLGDGQVHLWNATSDDLIEAVL
jgi:hypothetical protein